MSSGNKGRNKGDKVFDDTQMNPSTKQNKRGDGHAKPMNAEQTKKKLDGITRNVTGKSGKKD